MENSKNSLIIMKFGGSCLQNRESYLQVINIVNKYIKSTKILIVVSAIQGMTNKLIEFYEKSCSEENNCDELIEEIYNMHIQLVDDILEKDRVEYGETVEFLQTNIEELKHLGRLIRLIRPSADIYDLVVSYGEKLSTFLLSKYLITTGYKSNHIFSDKIIRTNDNFGRALPLLEETEVLVKEKLYPLLHSDKNNLVCVSGYYGSTKDNKISTLGRGGSDLSAAILAYALRNLFLCKIIYWKDVKGFLNADPRVAKKTSLIRNISYKEAKELAFFGAKILHPLCLDVNEKGKIPSEVRYFSEPNSEDFTTITKEIVKNDDAIKAITSIEELSMVTLESDTMVPLSGTASKLFSLLGDNNINIVFISQSSSENNITFGIEYEDSTKVSFLLRNSDFFGEKWFKIKIDNDISLVAVIGAGILYTPGIAGKVFTSLGDNKINILAIAQGSSELNFTAIIDRKNCRKAVNVLYDTFITR
ncbi:MAG: aspartate kinase [Candidatus Lokiarchaeota archaeon]|nr:aspartate kinase [Candidatus Lokiarchaeota archaeon]